MKKKLRCAIILLVLVTSLCFSQTKMPSFFSNNMVLQQQEMVAIWGKDVANTPIEISTSWGEKASVKTNADGKWMTKIHTTKASFNTYTITVKGTTTITLENVLIGEVWFCSGQSNMEMPMQGFKGAPVNNGDELIRTSMNKNIRLFNTERAASLSLEDDVVGNWAEANPESVKKFSAVGYLFGRTVFEKLQIPIGIIEASWGGTPIECWLPKPNIASYPEIKVPDVLPQEQNKQKRPTLLYNAMIHPFKNYAIKGFLWYQGEANIRNPKPYKNYMHTLVNSWRDQWQQTSLPFYFVQITPYDYFARYKNKANAFGANVVRQVQSLVAQEISNTGVVITSDIGKCNQIHPPEKYTVAKRLANWSLATDYNFKDIAHRSPEYKSIKIKGNKAVVSFNFFGKNKANHKLDDKMTLKDFVIAGKDHVFYPAHAKINKNNTITVFSDKVEHPVAVRYGFVNCLEGSLFSKSGLPISAFRTDSWDE